MIKVKGKTTLDLYFSMSAREAEVLASILHSVGSAPEGPRGVADAVVNELRNLNVSPRNVSSYVTLPDTWERFKELSKD
jgi:hypothetical protein